MDADSHDYFRRLNDAMDAAGMAWWEIELPSGVVFFAENKTRMLGYDRKDFVHYTDFTNLLHPDDHAAAMQAMQDHLSGKAEQYETHYRIRTKDGSYKKFYDRGKIVRKKDGDIRVAGVVIDVSNVQKFFDPTADRQA